MTEKHALRVIRSDEPRPGAVFRDPEATEREVRELRAGIARALVNVPSLPQELPAFDMTLLDVELDQRTIHLVLGKPDRIARLALTRDETRGASVVVEPLHPAAARLSRPLGTIAERVRRALSAERWREAQSLARRLLALPVGVPLGFFRQLVAGVSPPVGIVRTGFLCNQDCGMCWQDRKWGRYSSEQVATWIEDLHRAGARNLIVSGGEPTLDKDLVAHVARARALGFQHVTLETNAIRMSQPGYAESLQEAGLSGCFVSLHSADPAVSDAITRAPGTHKKTIAGILRLLELGLDVNLNAVVTAQGIESLPALPDFVASTFGKRIGGLMISFPSDPFDPALAADVVPHPERLRSLLPDVVRRALALGLPLERLNGPCGVPVCALGVPPPVELEPVRGSLDFRVYFPECGACAARGSCFGVPRGQADRFGKACIAPIPAASSALS